MLAAWAGLAALQLGIAVAYQGRGTWWHYLLHQMVGWGVGLAAAGVGTTLRRGSYVPPMAAAVAGQVVSIAPDLAFTYLRMPHTPAMDLWVGHISLHRGPSPVLVALGVALLGGAGWLSGRVRPPRRDARRRRRRGPAPARRLPARRARADPPGRLRASRVTDLRLSS